MEEYGWRNIADMSAIGSTSDVAVVVQYDTLDEQQYTPRFYIDGANNTGQLVEKLSPVNTGEPKNLTDFIVWAETNYPARHYALVLWNHGNGWKEDDIYARYREAVSDPNVRDVEGKRKRILRRTVFLPTAGQIMSIKDEDIRAICFDDSSMDFLDNYKLAEALVNAEKQTGQRLSVLGMDACLMSMIEVAYEIRDYADYMVSSQEVEPALGWPYQDILRTLVEKPSMSPLELSKLIVGEYGNYYMGMGRNGGGRNTQSAVNLRAVPQVFASLSLLTEQIIEVYERDDLYAEVAINRAKQGAQGFQDSDFLDLRHLMEVLRDEYVGKYGIGETAGNIATYLTDQSSEAAIVANFRGHSRPNANGLSIYFPAKACSPFYDKQSFASSRWNQVIRRVNRLVEDSS